MILRKYGIELRSMTLKDLDQVRTWRNDPVVRKHMFFQEFITEEEHLKWFESLEKSDQYFVVYSKDVAIAVINVKEIDFEDRTGEAGVFAGKEFQQSYELMLSIYCLMDAFFDDFNFSRLTATLRTDNENAITFNKALGYQILNETSDKVTMSISSKAYGEQSKSRDRLLASFVGKEKENHQLSSAEEREFLLK